MRAATLKHQRTPKKSICGSGFTAIHSGPLAVTAAAILVAATAHAQSQPALSHEAMTERVQAGISCHGKAGRTINQEYLPRIAGKPAGYLFNQLFNFRDGRRNSAVMTHLLQPLSDAYLREIATYFSTLELPYPAPDAAKANPTPFRRWQATARSRWRTPRTSSPGSSKAASPPPLQATRVHTACRRSTTCEQMRTSPTSPPTSAAVGAVPHLF